MVASGNIFLASPSVVCLASLELVHEADGILQATIPLCSPPSAAIVAARSLSIQPISKSPIPQEP
jgi:hypothetical protein